MSELKKDDKSSKMEETEKNIETTLEHLTYLLEKKKSQEEVQTSLVTSCESAGADYGACDPLQQGHCPPEEDFSTTFKDLPWSNIFTKNPKTGNMERCIPKYLIGRPTGAKATTRDKLRLEERLLRAINTIEGSYNKLVDASEFQWTTPCGEAVTEEQCGIMRAPPQVNQHTGSREFQEHGTRCYWAPTQDPKFGTQTSADAAPLCRPLDESPYKPIPMTQDYIATVQKTIDNVKSNVLDGKDGRLAAAEDSLNNLKLMDPYDRTRTRLSDNHYRDLNKAYVQMSLFPISEVLAATAVQAAHHHTFQSILDKSTEDDSGKTALKGGVALLIFESLSDKNLNSYIYADSTIKDKYNAQGTGKVGDVLNESDGKTYLSSKGTTATSLKDKPYQTMDNVKATLGEAITNGEPLTFNYGMLKKRLAEVKDLELCGQDSDGTNQYVWNFDGYFTNDQTTQETLASGDKNSFFLTSTVPASFKPKGDAADPKDKHYADVAKNDLWKFTHAALSSQAVFQAEFISLVERIHKAIKNDKLLEKLALPRDVPDSSDPKKTKRVYDLTPLKGLTDALPTLTSMFKENEMINKLADQKLNAVELNPEDVKLEIKEDKPDKLAIAEWVVATNMATAMVSAAHGGMGKIGAVSKPIYNKALHLAGLGGKPNLRWRAKVGAEVHVANFGNSEESDEDRRSRIQASVNRIERLQVANELKKALQKELTLKRGHRIMMAVQTSLENSRSPQQRYERAISYIPTLLAHNKDDEDGPSVSKEEIFQMVDREIKRRFNAPPHPLFYNEKTTLQADEKLTDPKQCDATEVTLSEQLACRYIKDAEEAAVQAKTKAESTEQIGKEINKLLQVQRSEMAAGRHRTNLSEALSLEEKFGSESFIDVKNKTYLPLKTLEDRLERSQKSY